VTASDNAAMLFLLAVIILIMWLCGASALYMATTVLITSMLAVLKHYSRED
jgi:sterol desaturase/sphingolipid hydroxylase (fatty acid hydroxylase superfamily)